ncbi:MAG: succinate dehydrogenase cytochrome b subunit [Bacteriovoracales bacterium]|nr:succinate dehydrogenase cytochrome b subunit [Bacteriovoracales bacterium]
MDQHLSTYLRSSVGKKQIMALTGLLLCGFLPAHLAGNFLLLISREAFNTYAHTLISHPLIYGAEAVLAALFLSHIGLGLKLTVENSKARPVRYHLKRPTGRGETLASKTMIYTGLWTLVFLVIHLFNFRLNPSLTKEKVVHGGIEMSDLYGLVMTHFQSLEWTIYYVVSTLFLGLHLSHGLASAFQSLGLHHPSYTPPLKKLSVIYAVAMTAGFSAVALFCHFKGQSL